MNDYDPHRQDPQTADGRRLADAVPVQDVPRILPRQPNGKKVHLSTLYRWLTRGRRGMRLPSFLVGGRRYVHLEDLYDWIDRLTQDATPPQDFSPPTPRQRQRQQAQTRRRVEEILYGRKGRPGNASG